jgi:hypothetical protein
VTLNLLATTAFNLTIVMPYVGVAEETVARANVATAEVEKCILAKCSVIEDKQLNKLNVNDRDLNLLLYSSENDH